MRHTRVTAPGAPHVTTVNHPRRRFRPESVVRFGGRAAATPRRENRRKNG
ncbi:hypothetical protein OH687_22880 [Burkholderia anthina]|nr:hypothetical protein OH687_22880 [Burkholderia anthina]